MAHQNQYICLNLQHKTSKCKTLNICGMRNLTLIVLFFLLLSSCSTIDFSDQPQGIIEYDVSYISNKSSMPTNLLPRKVILKFRAYKSITSINGFMGMFSLRNISDAKKNTNTMMLKVMDNKYFFSGEKNDPPFFFDGLKNIKITKVNGNEIIAGLQCHKAIVSFSDKSNEPFEILYTNEIKIKKPNKATPFNSIDGVLMQFNIQLSNIQMKLTASKYLKDQVSSDLFDIPKEYKSVSRDKLKGVLTKLLE